MKKLYLLTTRFAFFTIYAWFGILKILNVGQAFPLVSSLCSTLMPTVDANIFYVILGIIEIYIGVLFLFPKLTKFAIIFTTLHLFTTFLPFIFAINHTWLSFGVLTIEGQYILKNLFIISALIGLWIIQDEEGK